MKYIVKFFVITFFVFHFTHTSAEGKIVFINMDYILNESRVGKSVQTQLEKLHKNNLDYLMKIQNGLKDEEKDILSKKNILKQEEFEAKINKLREDAKEYQNSRVELTNELTQKRTEVTQKILNEIRPLLAKYLEENSVSFILDKKNVIVGKTSSDITNIIIKQLDNKLPKIEIN